MSRENLLLFSERVSPKKITPLQKKVFISKLKWRVDGEVPSLSSYISHRIIIQLSADIKMKKIYIFIFFILIFCNTFLYTIFLYGREPVLILRISIGFKAIPVP